MSQSSALCTIHDQLEIIESYVTATFTPYERVVVALVPTFEEPRIDDPDLVLGRRRFLIETLVGFAVGATAGAVARAARLGLGEEVRGGHGLLLGRLVGDDSPLAAVSEIVPPARFLRVWINPSAVDQIAYAARTQEVIAQ